MLVTILVFLAVSFLEISQASSVPEAESCGQRNSASHEFLFRRIVGGEHATLGSWPWQAELLRVQKNTTIYTHRCGGTLIDTQWVVTTASCIFMYPYPSHYKVVLGKIDRSELEESNQSEHVYDVACIQIHESYMLPSSGYGFDIALLKLATPATLKQGQLWPACLPSQGQRVAIGKECFMTGWGKTSFNSSFSDVLQEAKMPVVDHETCAAANINLPAAVDEQTMVCAGHGGNSVVSGCHGDGGGPFVCEESGRWILRGAISWGDPWCRAGSTFSVFTRISTFVDWIHNAKTKERCIAPPTDSECKDNLPVGFCGQFSSDGKCGNAWYANYLKMRCPESCNHCTK